MTSEALTLFPTKPDARRTDPVTSHQAPSEKHRGELEADIIDAFMRDRLYGQGSGLTDEELCIALAPRYAPTVKTCRSRLTNAGLLRDSGIKRKTSRGRDAIVWELAK